jgi:hypothetical protein
MWKLLVTGMLAVAALSAGDFTGTWLGLIPMSNSDGALNGGGQQVAFKFVQTGTRIEGKFYGDDETCIITDGKVTGDEITFFLVATEQQGNSIVETHLRFTGRIDSNGEIELTRIRESAINAANGTVYKWRPENTKRTFRLKRLL